MNKKAQGLSMNVIIIAAIALLVLVILSVLLLKTSDTLFKGTACEGVGGDCISADDTCGDMYRSSNQRCKKDDAGNKQVCCVPLEENE